MATGANDQSVLLLDERDKALGLAEQQQVTDALGRRTAYTYDALGNVTSVQRLAGTADAVTTQYTYEPIFSELASVTDPLSHTTSFTRDEKGNLIRATDPVGSAWTFTYNAAGQVLSATDPLGHATGFTYDGGDLVSVSDPLGNTVSRFVDAAGRLVVAHDATGNATQYQHDALNRVTAITDALGGQTSFAYDANGNLLALTDARGHSTVSAYDAMDRVSSRTDPLQRTEASTYDANGNPASVTDRLGHVTTTTFDALHRLVSSATASDTIAYTSDAGNRLTQISTPTSFWGSPSSITRAYDGLDRLVSETASTPWAQATSTVTYTYDAAGRRTTMTVAGQPATAYSYDAAGRVTGVSRDAASVSLAYDAAGRRTALGLPNGVVVESTYDAASQVTGLTYRTGTSPLGTLTYTYDARGHRTAVGGTLARTGLPVAVSGATYDAANQLTQWDVRTLSYDPNGRLHFDGTNGYAWDLRGRLVYTWGAGFALFDYDALGRRTLRTTPAASSIRTVYDGLNPVQESGQTPTATVLTGLGLDEVFARTDASGTVSVLADALGSTVALTDATGALATQYTYEPFGATTATGPASANTQQFTGRENDGNGLYYYRARYYSTTLQRFISEDPLGFAGGDANLHAYVGNNPTRHRDPSGLAVILPPPWCQSGGRKDPPPLIQFLCNHPQILVVPDTIVSLPFELSIHALEQMMARGVGYSSIEEAIGRGLQSAGNQPGTTQYDLSSAVSSTGRGIRVVINSITRVVITVIDKGSDYVP
jgi:RHS repeat-associated protein